MARSNIFHTDYREFPYWWEAYQPSSSSLADLPGQARVVIIGAGYAGLATALELHRLGIDAVVLDAEDPGYGASTRSGGMVGGGDGAKRSLVAGKPSVNDKAATISEAADALAFVEQLIRTENIECGWSRTGRFTGAWSKAHFRQMAEQADMANEAAGVGAKVISPEQQREEIGSDFYHGGLVTEKAAHLHPAQYFAGLKKVCDNRGITICAQAGVETLVRSGNGWLIKTSRGEITAGDVVVATNGYTGAVTPTLQRKVVPLQPYIIATEELPEDLAHSLSPKNRSFADTMRVVSFFRLSSDRRRMIFGSRVKWRDISPTEMAPLLYKRMIKRYPQLAGCRITHAWSGNVAITFDERPHFNQEDGLHYVMGCNGTGVSRMTYLGTKLARKIAGAANSTSPFETPMPGHPLYDGKSHWFLPIIGNYFRIRDRIDRHRP